MQQNWSNWYIGLQGDKNLPGLMTFRVCQNESDKNLQTDFVGFRELATILVLVVKLSR